MKRFYDRKGLQIFIGITVFSILWLIAFAFSFDFEMWFNAEALQEFIWSLPDIIGASMIFLISVGIIIVSVISAVGGYKSLFISSILTVGVPVVSEMIISFLSSDEALGFLFFPVFFICYPFGMLCYWAIDSFTSCFGYFGDMPFPLFDNVSVVRGLFVVALIISVITFCAAYEKPALKEATK